MQDWSVSVSKKYWRKNLQFSKIEEKKSPACHHPRAEGKNDEERFSVDFECKRTRLRRKDCLNEEEKEKG